MRASRGATAMNNNTKIVTASDLCQKNATNCRWERISGMNISPASQPAARKPIRLWPGVVAVIVLVLASTTEVTAGAAEEWS